MSTPTSATDGGDHMNVSDTLHRITQYTPDLTQGQVDATIAKAFQLYSDVIPIDFKQIYRGTADIMILFKARCESALTERHL